MEIKLLFYMYFIWINGWLCTVKYEKMVPPAGIEPALPKERDFESRASTNSTRGA